MDKELILWASFIHDMGKLFQKCQWLETSENDGKDTKNAFQKFLKGKSPEQKWFPEIFQQHFNPLFLLSYYSCEGDVEEGKTSGKLDESVLPYVKIISRADQLSGRIWCQVIYLLFFLGKKSKVLSFLTKKLQKRLSFR